jgi:hypothetical protein
MVTTSYWRPALNITDPHDAIGTFGTSRARGRRRPGFAHWVPLQELIEVLDRGGIGTLGTARVRARKAWTEPRRSPARDGAAGTTAGGAARKRQRGARR